MVKENLDGKQIEHVLVEDGTYDGEIVEVSNIYEAKNLDGQPTEKLRVDIRTDGGDDIPHFMTAIVSNAAERNPRYRNSKLYDLLSKAGAVDAYQAIRAKIFDASFSQEQQNDFFVNFLRKSLVGRSVQLITMTVTSASGEKYSVVGEILYFVDSTVTGKTGETNTAKIS